MCGLCFILQIMFQIGDVCKAGKVEAVVLGVDKSRVRLLEFKRDPPRIPFWFEASECSPIPKPTTGPTYCVKSKQCKQSLNQHVWPYCNKCMRETWGVDVRRSRVSGFGLFACKNFAKGDVIVPYSARYPQRAVFEKFEGKQQYAQRLKEMRSRNPHGNYMMGTVDDKGKSCFMDSQEWQNYPGRFANDSRDRKTCNIEVFEGRDTVTIELALRRQYYASVDIVAKQSICKDEELFLAYGDEYWLSYLVEEHLDFPDVPSMMQSFGTEVKKLSYCSVWLQHHTVNPIPNINLEVQLLMNKCRAVALDLIAEALCMPSHKTYKFWQLLRKRMTGQGLHGLMSLCRQYNIVIPVSTDIQAFILRQVLVEMQQVF